MGATVETHRKPSIKTEDFINEANKIMAMIRSKAGLPSGLASVEESDEEKGQPSPELDGSFEESTQEPFSRPPSREGRPPLTRMSTKQEDPVLAEQLKKYEEASDMGDLIPSSVRSTRLAEVTREQATAEWANSQSQTSEHHSEVVSDPPNIRISRNPDWQEKHSANGRDDAMPGQGSARFNTQSTGVSFPTVSSGGSSRGSEARKTIMPESVCHLIPDQVGNMILDRQRNMWVKRKGSAESKESFIQSEISEDDPFADIPDLSVDVTREMQNLLLTRKKEAALQDRDPSAAQISPTKPHRVGSLTRAALDAAAASPTNQYPHPGGAEEFVEHEISVNEGRVETRRLTISFSSPVASVIQDVAGINDMMSKDNMLDQTTDARDQPARGRRIVSIHKTTNRSARSRSTSRGPARHLSFRGKSLMARPVSRIDERDEDSGSGNGRGHEAVSGMELSILGDYSLANRDDNDGHGSLSILVATPARAPTCPASGVDAAPIISQYVGTFSLSPLPDFTMHRAEETLPLEASYVVDDHRLVTGDKSKRIMSMAMRELVEKLAEVEPFEPYWEDMRELELREKRLSALQALDEYCGQLESLDVSKNMIRNLGGIPSSILHLRITDNQLSSLTAWNHLMNLQYIDVSNNSLTSLAVFKSLIHLRSLRADNNQITSLDGIKFHKGLQTLRMRGNLIEQVDFDGNTLHQLTDLDLKNNQISHIANVDQLPSLSSLNLDSNQLTSFSVDAAQSMTALRYLRLDDNNLTSLNVRALPHLRLLHADRNALVHISGFSRARRIDSLSLREQHGTAPLDLAHLLARAYEVRKLYLSGNLLESFSPRIDLLNLQLLELANCGLSTLPEEVGLMMPNLRVLNLNMNALSDLAPLRAVPRLKRLFVVGNRLADPARVIGTLGGMACLSVVDLRDNPLTQGFYAPVQVVVHQRRKGTVTNEKDDDEGGDGGGEGGEQFALGDQDAERDARYCARLDMDTRVRRRLYETMVGKRCGRVRRLDGLVLGGKKNAVGGGDNEGTEADMVLAVMVEKGLVKRRASDQQRQPESGRDVSEEKGVVAPAADRSGRWPAEDSFA
jgi:Leucine-rich repeat (LRR) protein